MNLLLWIIKAIENNKKAIENIKLQQKYCNWTLKKKKRVGKRVLISLILILNYIVV